MRDHGKQGPHRHRHGCPEGRDCRCAENGPRVHGFLIPCLLLQLQSGPAHGYHLMDVLAKRAYLPHLPDPGVVYRHLRKLEQEGLVLSGFQPGDGPARRVYEITDEGRRCLGDWVEGIVSLRGSLEDFLRDARASIQ